MPAKMAASRRLSFELYTSRLIEGHNPDPATLRWFLEEEQRCMPPPEPLRVTVNIVNPSWTKCPCCAHVFDPDSPERTPDPTPPTPPSTPPTETTKPSPPAPSAAPTNVVALSRQPISDTMRRFNQLHGYSIAPDGGLGRGNPSRGAVVW